MVGTLWFGMLIGSGISDWLVRVEDVVNEGSEPTGGRGVHIMMTLYDAPLREVSSAKRS